MDDKITEVKTVNVPCGNCTICCQRDTTYLHPELGDDPEMYQTEIRQRRVMLAHKKNGDCIYLDRDTGCTIYERRPAICRELDCRLILDWPRNQRKALVRNKTLNKKLIQAARECKKRGEQNA